MLAGTNACFFNTAVQVLRATPGLIDGLRHAPELRAEAAQNRPLTAAFRELVIQVF